MHQKYSHTAIGSLKFGLALLLPLSCFAQRIESREYSVADVKHGAIQIIGELGLPLGTVAEIEATIVDGASINPWDFKAIFLLSIEKVNGKQLSQPCVLQFRAPFRRVNLVSDEDELPNIEDRVAERKKVTDAELKRMRHDYVGSRYTLAVYEEGQFSGRPEVLPDDCPPWSGRSFSFRTALVVLAIRKK